MKLNLLCDKNGIKRKNPMIIIEPDEIQQVIHSLSIETCESKIKKILLFIENKNS
jgi:hypothetical protein